MWTDALVICPKQNALTPLFLFFSLPAVFWYFKGQGATVFLARNVGRLNTQQPNPSISLWLLCVDEELSALPRLFYFSLCPRLVRAHQLSSGGGALHTEGEEQNPGGEFFFKILGGEFTLMILATYWPVQENADDLSPFFTHPFPL